jgi:hypothetical protein
MPAFSSPFDLPGIRRPGLLGVGVFPDTPSMPPSSDHRLPQRKDTLSRSTRACKYRIDQTASHCRKNISLFLPDLCIASILKDGNAKQSAY